MVPIKPLRLLAFLGAVTGLAHCARTESGLAGNTPPTSIAAGDDQDTPQLQQGSGGAADANDAAGNADNANGNANNGNGVGAYDPNVSDAGEALFTVTDGLISSDIDPYWCLDHPKNANDRTMKVQFWSCNKTPTQRFLYSGSKLLSNEDASGCVKLGAPRADGAYAVLMQACDSSDPNQLWRRTPKAWHNDAQNVCLAVDGGNFVYTDPLVARRCDGTISQQWSFIAPYTASVIDPLLSQTTVAGRCNPTLVVGNRLTGDVATAFAKVAPDPTALVRSRLAKDCSLLFANANDVPSGRVGAQLLLSPDANDVVPGDIYRTLWLSVGTLMPTGSTQLSSQGLGQVDAAIAAYYLNLTQNNSDRWLKEGLQWYVRIKNGGWPDSYKVKTLRYDQGGYTAGYFLIWFETWYPDFVKLLVKKFLSSSDPVNDAWFQATTGMTLDALWDAYLKSF